MENLYFGIFVISICIIGYYYSWKSLCYNKYVIAILLLIFCGLILRIYVANDLFLHIWDERFHALVAKNLIKHPLIPTLYDNAILPYDYKNWTANHIWVHKQPLSLWSMAFSMWLFGINEIALRLPSIILSTIGIWFTYLIGKNLFNFKIGYISAFLYSIHGLIIELTAGRVPTDHIDIFFLFFIELSILFAIYFAQTKILFFNIFCGISKGLAILSKWLPALIVIPIWFLLLMNSRKFNNKEIIIDFLVLSITLIIIALPWQIYIANAFPNESHWESTYNYKHIIEGLGGQEKPFYYYLDLVRINYGELIYLPIIWFCWKMFKDIQNKNRLIILIWFLIPMLFFSVVKTKMQGYILFTSPAIFIITAIFWNYLYHYRKKFKYKLIIYSILFLLIALPIRYSIERIKPFKIFERNPQWVTDLKKLNEKKIGKCVLFNYNKPIEAMFYTNFIVYPNIPDKKTVLDLQRKGYNIYINVNQNVPEDIKKIKYVIIENLTTTN